MIKKENVLVVLPAGGEGSRIQDLTRDEHHKVTLPLGEKALIEHVLEMYRNAGLRRFLVLVRHQRQSVEDLIGNGAKYGVSIKYSEDNPQWKGKGGALYNALISGLIHDEELVIVHNPDDLILDAPNFSAGAFPDFILAQYSTREDQQKKSIAVIGIRAKHPPTDSMTPLHGDFFHFAVTMLTGAMIRTFPSFMDLEKVVNYEKALFPQLIEQDSLGMIEIPASCWGGVNTRQDYASLRKKLEREHHG